MSPAPASAESDDPWRWARPVFHFTALCLVTGLLVGHEIFGRQPALYLAPGYGPKPWLVALSAAALFGAGVFVSRRSSRDPRFRFVTSLVVLALTVSASGPLLFFGFERKALLFAAYFAVPGICSSCLGIALHSGALALRRALLGLDIVRWLLSPFRLALGLCALIAGLMTADVIGVWRSATALGMLLAILGAWAPALFAYLDGVRFHGARWFELASRAALVLALAIFALSLKFTPPSDHSAYAADVIFSSFGREQRYVVTSTQQGFALFVDRMLKLSSVDDYRFAESLVHPACALAQRRARVLILGSGDGLVEREVLRYPDVREVTVVVSDARLARLARTLPWLETRSDAAMASPKIRVIEAEPMPWLDASRQVFDLAFVDLPDPSNFVEGKHYTRYFYRLLKAHLTPDGIAAVQATSVSGTPRSFASIRASLETAGFFTLPYHAALPSLGDWGFVLAMQQQKPRPARVPGGLRFLSTNTLGGLFALPASLRDTHAEPSVLHDQRTVALFEEEQKALFPER
jgi:spermidine synthase